MKTIKKQSAMPNKINPTNIPKEMSGIMFSSGVKIKIGQQVIRHIRGD